jgi:hypothetical protein
MYTLFRRSLAGLILIFVIWILAMDVLDREIENASKLLQRTKPIAEPVATLTISDPVSGKTVRQLFDSQMRSLLALRTNKDPGLIPLLISYLDYSTYTIPPYMGSTIDNTPPPDMDSICAHFPAFAAIVGTPGAAAVLADYAMNPKNRLRLRIASYQVLGYLDKDKFDVVSKDFDKEFAGSDRGIKVFLDAVEKGTAPFKGVYPLPDK